ncbi:MAG: NAD-dependent protein deacylase [Rubrivivax sp.]|nr:NAD-dependent protein deacylase [Rubrivivax sp.]
MSEQQPAGGSLAAVRDALGDARQVAVLTGAGMSAESGIPTFRDALTGLWANFDPEALASIEGFRADPARVYRWYVERREGVRRAEPNAGHVALAAWARRHPGSMTVITQNVDDLHQRAGQPGVIRLHGDILADQWLEPCRHPAVPGRPCDPADADEGQPPKCARCANLARPAVVWFGEALPEAALARAERAARECQLMLVVGTSGAVWPAAGLALQARRAGARVVILNPADSEIDVVAHDLLRGTAARLLPLLLGGGVAC